MPYYGFYFDVWYIPVIIAVLFSLWASARVNSTFKKYSAVPSRGGMTGADAAYRVLSANGVHDVRIERVSGNLTDHYDPKTKTLRLSDSVYGASTAAAVGVAAHEAGHAVQHAQGYLPLQLRNAIIPATNFGSRLSTPLILIGLILNGMSENFIVLAYIGVLLFGLSLLFQLLTLPTEFNASRRALNTISANGMLAGEDYTAAKKVLSAAAMTYVAATAVAITQIFRLLVLVSRNDRRR